VADEDILSDELLRQLISVGEVDILVGLHTYNHAKTIGHVVQVIREGLLKYFPRERVAIVNADGGSQDGTPDLVRAASISDARNSYTFHTLRTLHCISSQYASTPSTGQAMHIVVAAADLLRARACAVIAPESSEIVPDWIDRLLRPIYREHFDYVSPVYRRHRFEGTLVTNLLYPMMRALYGKRIREPRPGEFAFSSDFAGQLVGNELWTSDGGRLGPEVCITMTALSEGLRIFQTFLGPKGHLEQQSSDLVAALRQTVGPLFWSMERADASWSSVNDVQSVPTAGPEYEVTTEAVDVAPKRLHQMFCSGVTDLQPVLKSILAPATLAEFQNAAALEVDKFRYSDELWVKAVYEFAASYHRSVISRDHILQALVPLYRGRAYAYLTENSTASQDGMEEHIEALCLTFERLKPYLIEQWTAQERGS
jgi:glucosylglycerate synthase